MILSCVSVLILIMSPVLSAALVAPNSLSIQEILDYFVNYILINVFILNSTEAFLKFSFITLCISDITKLSHFFLQPFCFLLPLEVLLFLFCSERPKVKGNDFQEMMLCACLQANPYVFSGCKHSRLGVKGQGPALHFQICIKLCISGAMSIHGSDTLVQNKKVVKLFLLLGGTCLLTFLWT